MKRTIYDYAFRAGIWCVIALIALGIGLGILDLVSPRHSVLKESAWVQPTALFITLVFGLSALVLWYEAWLLFVQQRTEWDSTTQVVLLLILITGPVFAGYGFHVYATRKRRDGNASPRRPKLYPDT